MEPDRKVYLIFHRNRHVGKAKRVKSCLHGFDGINIEILDINSFLQLFQRRYSSSNSNENFSENISLVNQKSCVQSRLIWAWSNLQCFAGTSQTVLSPPFIFVFRKTFLLKTANVYYQLSPCIYFVHNGSFLICRLNSKDSSGQIQ